MGSVKTIVIPIYNGLRARNFFRSDTYPELLRDVAIRLVVAIPSAKLDYYQKEFPESGVIFEPLDITSESRFGRILNKFAFNLLHTKTVRWKQKVLYHRHRTLVRFVMWRTLNYVFGPLPMTRFIIQLLDRLVALDQNVCALLEKYNPSLVIAPDNAFPVDRIFLRAAQHKNIYTLGMVRSWDNLTSKGILQVLPDRMIVYTTIMKKEAMRLAGMRSEDIVVTGPPQFDAHFRDPAISRDEFLRELGIPSDRKVILCAPFFNDYMKSPALLINGLTAAIDSGKLPRTVHILVRYRAGNAEIAEGLLNPSAHLTITHPSSRHFSAKNIQSPTDDFEYSKEDVALLMNSLQYSDVVINTVSTLTIDAAAVDKPVISVRFDADPECPAEYSATVLPKGHDHYELLEQCGGVAITRNFDELVDALKKYLENPALDREGRRRIVKEQIEIADGQAGKRVADEIKKILRLLR